MVYIDIKSTATSLLIQTLKKSSTFKHQILQDWQVGKTLKKIYYGQINIYQVLEHSYL